LGDKTEKGGPLQKRVEKGAIKNREAGKKKLQHPLKKNTANGITDKIREG